MGAIYGPYYTREETRNSVQNQKTPHRKHDKLTNVAIITVYAAVDSTATGSMWQTQKRKIMALPPGERQEYRSRAGDLAGPVADPHKQLRYDLAQHMQELKQKHHCNFIVMGDFNINLNRNTPQLRNMMDWGETEGLTNLYLDRLGPTSRDQVNFIKDPSNAKHLWNTWYKSVATDPKPPSGIRSLIEDHEEETCSHVDHVWVSNDLVRRQCVVDYKVAQPQVANTDNFRSWRNAGTSPD